MPFFVGYTLHIRGRQKLATLPNWRIKLPCTTDIHVLGIEREISLRAGISMPSCDLHKNCHLIRELQKFTLFVHREC